MTEPRVVHRDSHLLVIDKPSGLATTSPDGANCLASWARQHDPEAPRMHASSRLDAEVTGLVTFARSELAIAQLLAARAAGRYRRSYLGLSARAPVEPAGEWSWSIALDPRDRRRRIALEHASAASGAERAQAARSRYRTLCALEQVALLLLLPETGRTHQLRVHAARAGAPLLGDKHYGGPTRVTQPDGRVVAARRVMLHCAYLSLPGIDQERPLALGVEPPEDFCKLFAALGGSDELLESAMVAAANSGGET